jgi:hypothetical protein
MCDELEFLDTREGWRNDGWDCYEGWSCYKFHYNTMDWKKAYETCESVNASLVIIDNSEENEVVTNLTNRAFWIGLFEIPPLKFVWIHNFTSRYRNWAEGEPKNVGGSNCGLVIRLSQHWNDRHWNDRQCNRNASFMCEKGCSKLVSPIHGKVSKHNTSFGSTATFTCNSRYYLVGHSSITCHSNFLWSSDVPSCESAEKVYLRQIRNAKSISELHRIVVTKITADNYSPKLAEAVTTKLNNLTSNRTLNSSEVYGTVNVLNSLVTLHEDILEGEENFTLSNEFVKTYLQVSDSLLSTRSANSWLSLDSNEGAPAYLDTMERFCRATAFSRAAEINQSLDIHSDNVALTISSLSNLTVREVALPVVTSPGGLAVCSLAYNNLQKFMPPNTAVTVHTGSLSVGDLRKDSDTLPGSSIKSLSIVKTGQRFSSTNNRSTLARPIQIYFHNVEYHKNTKVSCSFWQFGRNSDPGFWSSFGVTTHVINDTTILCKSSHLTSFSVLVAVQDPALSDTLSYITYIGCGISLACLSVALICLVCLRRYLRFEKNFIHINFIIALMLALIFFLAGIDRSNDKDICRAMTVIMHYLFLAVFCWMLCEGILLYLMLIVVFKSNKSYSKHFFCLGWGLPLVVVAISFGVRFDLYGDSDYCFLTQHSGLIYAFVGPMAAILLANFVIFVIVLKIAVSRTSDSEGQVAAAKSGLRAAAVLLPILGLTWIIGVFAIDSLSLTLAYIFTILNSLQGLFVLLFHCLLDKGVHRAFKKVQRKYVTDTSTINSRRPSRGVTSVDTTLVTSVTEQNHSYTSQEDATSPSIPSATAYSTSNNNSSSFKEEESKMEVETQIKVAYERFTEEGKESELAHPDSPEP